MPFSNPDEGIKKISMDRHPQAGVRREKKGLDEHHNLFNNQLNYIVEQSYDAEY
ncbi:hypothetical protein [Olivibacter domesticus]|uniref:Uncharacterized protein n=1 Tax=Olivibacter domesticus TaxID=407022 RepID=A0A1H7LHC3_OLID1|nr:hypothetical protein [Olivibacter domesticus]SEK97777.1 hypothetical protein SAMN05661044_01660 [Olivibacter domesticus]